ncbi:hypothetical protein Dsin_032335 [Dipteronia sinensis]|uniref:Uncharacterized protein n=1 Tax=Dipteronia sinensis TaxID=43782 RepID=A0AAD9ZPH7_9ROSI|nr:hypothetical protein Dsin_032335 [Dipteronia sinensis]
MQQKEVGTSNRKRKREESPKSLLQGKECDGIAGAVDEIIVEDCTTNGLELAIIGEPTELTDSSSKAKDIEMAIVPSNMVYADEHLSIFPPTIWVDSRLSTGQVRVKGDCMTLLCNMIQWKARLTICHTSIKAFDCLKVVHHQYGVSFNLRLMPQQPHFRPLNECNEIFREGLAIAQWITFAKVEEQTSELQVDASRSTFDSIIECISELESHGFDVKAVRCRLLELQTMKESQEQLQTKLEDFKCEIVERSTCKKLKIMAELDDASKELKVLEEKINVVDESKTRLVSMIQENDYRIALLNLSDDC